MKQCAIIIIFSFFVFEVSIAGNKNLKFIENQSQWENHVKFKADVQFGHIYFSSNFFRYVFYNEADLESIHEMKHQDYFKSYELPVQCHAYDVQFVGSNSNPRIIPSEKLTYYQNYFLGNDPKKWAGNVSTFQTITYSNLYNGVDLKAYSIENSFKYDLIVHAGTNPKNIKLKYNGVKPILNSDGTLNLNLGFKTLAESAPISYQIIDGKKIPVASNYQLSKEGEITFEFPKSFNSNYDLIIDPTLVFATYSSSTATTYGFSATYDLNGSLYAGGECFNVGWPTSVGAFQTTYGGSVDAGINKYDPLGTSIIYSTYFGGSSSDVPNNLVVNAANELAVTGSTSSSNMPTTPGAFDNTLGGSSDAYVARFNATGSALLGATYVGGSSADAQNIYSLSPNYGDGNRGEIFYDVNNDIVVAVSTQSSDFPVTAGAYQGTYGGGTQDGCFFKLDGTCSNLIFSTFLGGSNEDACFSIAKNSLGNWVLCGGTKSNNFPTTGGAATIIAPGGTDAFVTILNNNATNLVSSTYIGTSDFDHAFKVQVDPLDTVYVCGQTQGAAFPVSAGVYSNPGSSIFIQKYTPSLNSMVLSTRIGQTSSLVPTAFLKDNCGNVYFTGFQAQSGLPLTPNAYQSTAGGFWLCVLSGDFSSLVYATYMGVSGDHVDGGTSRFDPQGIVYHSVCTISGNQYQSPGCLSPTNVASSWDVASFKFDFELAGVSASLILSPNDSGCAPFLVNFTNTSVAGVNYYWDFGDGGTSTLASPSHTYLTPGNFQVRLIADNPNGCISSDTAYSTIQVIDAVDASFTSQVVLDCKNDTVHLTLNNPSSSPSVLYNWNFGDGNLSVINNPTHYYQNQGIYTITCIATNGFCHDTVNQTINTFHPINAVLGITKDSICLGDVLNADASQSVPQGFLTYTWIWGDGNVTNSSNNSESHVYANDGEYTMMLVVTDTIGCHDTDTHKIFVDKSSYVDFSILDDEVCVGQPIQLLDTIAPHTISFEWDFGDGNKVSNVHNPKYNYDIAGNYNITLTGYYLVCTPLSKQLPVIINEYPKVNLGPDTMMCPGLTGSITLSDNSSAGSHIWSTGETSTSIIVTEPGRYWVEGSIGECKSVDSIWIKRDCYLNIPNSFSPNGDGLNDYFLPRELLSNGLTTFTMSIYNRWGEKIFATDKIDGRGWDGKFNGVNQPQGVYVYVIDAIFRSNLKKNFTGNVTLMR